MSAPERMNIVITGHVDHGKSTLVGRLLADTHSLPEGKLDAVREMCKKNGRVFEYAFLLDALDDEQKQGITIDSARIFFKSARREYIIIDAPGHIEFLRNMLSGASRAEAAVLVIDAVEGVAENSRRHGLLLSLLGISQVVVVVNKMDAINYDEAVFARIKNEYAAYLAELKITPAAFVPASAREGKNLIAAAAEMPWYRGKTVLEILDGFHNHAPDDADFFALPVQDIYRFSDDGDNRRIFSGTVASGKIAVGEAVTFLPSGKMSRVKSVEVWNAPEKTAVGAGEAVGLTLTEEIYVKRGEVMIKTNEPAPVAAVERIRANVMWLGARPLAPQHTYLLKLGAAKVSAQLEKIERIFGDDDTGDSPNANGAEELRRHHSGAVVLKLSHPLVVTKFADSQTLGRFVIVDNYDAVGGGIVQEILIADTASTAGTSPSFSNATAASRDDFIDELFALLRRHFPERF